MDNTKTTKRRSPARILLRIVLILLALIVLAALVLWIIPLTERDDGSTVDGSADWMAKVDGSQSLSALAIPGTHDSATQYSQLAFFSKCQTKDIRAQLDAGFRYLDIRLAVDGDRLKLVHGFTACKTGPMPWSDTLYLDDVLDQCYAFLKEHPTETILFVVKQDCKVRDSFRVAYTDLLCGIPIHVDSPVVPTNVALFSVIYIPCV